MSGYPNNPLWAGDHDTEPTTKAGRRLFTDNEPMDMWESDGVTWADVVAIETQAVSAEMDRDHRIAELEAALQDLINAFEAREAGWWVGHFDEALPRARNLLTGSGALRGSDEEGAG